MAAASVRLAISIWMGISTRSRARLRFLPPQFGLGFIDLGSGQVDFVAIEDRIDLRQHLSLLDMIVLLNQETAKAAGDGLRSYVDNVRLNERVFGFRTQQAGANPALRRCNDQDRHDNHADDDPSSCETAVVP